MELHAATSVLDIRALLIAATASCILALPSSAAPSVDVARATAWLAERVPQLVENSNTPVRVLALTALALQDSPTADPLMQALRARQDSSGWWAAPTTYNAITDQALAVLAASSRGDLDRARMGAARLCDAQDARGGWSVSTGRRAHANALSTALASLALFYANYALAANTGGKALAPRLEAAHRSARAFLEHLQIEDTGALGYEGAVKGDWGSTAAGLAGMTIGGSGHSLAWRRAVVALGRPEVRSRSAHQPLIACMVACWTLHMLPGPIQADLRRTLLDEISAHQQRDGRWTTPRASRGDYDEFATAAMLTCLRWMNDAASPPLFRPPSPDGFVVTNSPLPNATFVLYLPAERADLLLLDFSRVHTARLIAAYDVFDVHQAFNGRASLPGSRKLRPWARAYAGLIERARAGPVVLDAIPFAIAETNRIKAEYIFSAEEIAALIDSLDAAAEARLAEKLSALDIQPLFHEARELLAAGRLDALQALMEEHLPDELQPAIRELRKQAADRIRAASGQGAPLIVALDVWLALGPDGVLARLSRPPLQPEVLPASE